MKAVLPLCVLAFISTPQSVSFLTRIAIQSRRHVNRPPSYATAAADRAQRRDIRRTITTMAAATTTRAIIWPDSMPTPSMDQPVRSRIVAVAPASINSPFDDRGKPVTWFEVWEHIGRRVKWADPGLEMQVFQAEELDENSGKGDERARFRDVAATADVFVGSAVQDASTAKFVSTVIQEAGIQTRFSVGCAPELSETSILGGFRPEPAASPLIQVLPDFLRDLIGGPGTGTAKDRKLWDTLTGFYKRNSSEDLTFLTLLLVDTYSSPVPRVTGIAKDSSPDTVKCMIKNCRQEVIKCAKDPDCRACISCLTNCPQNDQVCAYRCITSYETATMEAFSMCVLQKHNCMCNSAEIPTLPDPAPMTRFRGEPVTPEVAEDLFIGWLGKEAYSWKVVCGQNPAYDFFPSQHQIFYRGKGRGQMWYDPVFKVFTLNGEQVWRRRHYRVKAAATPGTFRFSVLDNGVVSNEYWRIIDVSDDLSWGVFYYAGAATAAGQSYTGALLVSREGSWPEDGEMERVEKAFDTCGIKLWELYEVDNSDPCGAPLGLPGDYAANNARPLLV